MKHGWSLFYRRFYFICHGDSSHCSMKATFGLFHIGSGEPSTLLLNPVLCLSHLMADWGCSALSTDQFTVVQAVLLSLPGSDNLTLGATLGDDGSLLPVRRNHAESCLYVRTTVTRSHLKPELAYAAVYFKV
ncbi:hypothetical protein CHARACLAT_032444 [Characodon lateralis]|uniref:Uncharacterized protein n=1 Tax=Characodon lateralis TaxID=208331 RepID=A0ABU7DC80_9TELE|nr:hypothetical protein [Characodon lateralis]